MTEEHIEMKTGLRKPFQKKKIYRMLTGGLYRKRTNIKKSLLSAAVIACAVCLLCCSCRPDREQDAGQSSSNPAQIPAEESTDGKSFSSGQEGKGSSTLPADTGSGMESGSAESEADSAPEKQKKDLQDIYKVGDVLQDGALKIVYAASGEYQEENEYLQPQAGCKYIFLRFSFENISSGSECQISLFSFSCYADGFAAQAYYGGRNDLASVLPPGRMASGCIYYSVPEDAGEIEIEYRPASLSADKICFAFEGDLDAGYLPPAKTERTEGAIDIGSTVKNGGIELSYLSCTRDDSDSEFIRPAEGCSFYTLSFELENLQAEDLETGTYDFHCYADGTDCPCRLFRDDYLSASIPQGRKAKGTVTFEIPDGAQTVEAEYTLDRGTNEHITFTVR